MDIHKKFREVFPLVDLAKDYFNKFLDELVESSKHGIRAVYWFSCFIVITYIIIRIVLFILSSNNWKY